MKKTRFSILVISALIMNAGATALAAENDEAPPATSNKVAGIPKSTLAPKFSGNIGEVVKLSESGVDESVMLAFVRNSSVAFNPSADEIIKLREAGISSSVITAMLERGGELRQRAAAS